MSLCTATVLTFQMTKYCTGFSIAMCLGQHGAKVVLMGRRISMTLCPRWWPRGLKFAASGFFSAIFRAHMLRTVPSSGPVLWIRVDLFALSHRVDFAAATCERRPTLAAVQTAISRYGHLSIFVICQFRGWQLPRAPRRAHQCQGIPDRPSRGRLGCLQHVLPGTWLLVTMLLAKCCPPFLHRAFRPTRGTAGAQSSTSVPCSRDGALWDDRHCLI